MCGVSHFPFGKCGLKCIRLIVVCCPPSHFPFGKCGLKFLYIRFHLIPVVSLPVWEVWIEIRNRRAKAADA